MIGDNMHEEDDFDIGAFVRFHRKRSSLTQAQLAKLAGVGKTAVFDIEKNKQSIQFDTLKKVLKVLNVSIEFRSPLKKEFEESRHEKS